MNFAKFPAQDAICRLIHDKDDHELQNYKHLVSVNGKMAALYASNVTGEIHVQKWLESAKLECLYDACIKEGWDDMYAMIFRANVSILELQCWSTMNL